MRRVLTALVLIPVIVYVVLWAPWWAFGAVLAAAACLCYREYDHLAAAYGFGAPGPLGYAVGLLLLFVDREPWTWLMLTMAGLLALGVAMKAEDLSKSLPRVALLLFGIVYIFGCWKCALPLRARSPHWLLYALLVNWAGDIGAYYAGRALGRHKLARRVSPQKTWEGFAGSVLASLLIAGGYLMRFLAGVTIPQAIGLTVAVNVAGQVGDLAESAIKRGAGVKDSGALLPGHGGLLDRVDSTLFALPVVYTFTQWLA